MFELLCGIDFIDAENLGIDLIDAANLRLAKE